eukprot:gene30453-37672_t
MSRRVKPCAAYASELRRHPSPVQPSPILPMIAPARFGAGPERRPSGGAADGTDLVKAFESCLKPVSGRKGFFTTYICPAGVLTIAWGHTNDHGRTFKAGEVWSQAECDAALAQDLATFETSVSTILKDVPWPRLKASAPAPPMTAKSPWPK